MILLAKRVLKNRWFFSLLLLIGYGVLYFFLKDKFIFTPDFAGPDVFDFNIANKYHLWKSIRSGIIPFWTDKLDGGFPIVAESQMGTFFLPYYVIFPLFSSFSHAYAFLSSFHLFLLTAGMYLLLRVFKIRPSLSFLLSIIFAWNGSITFRWVHFTVLQAFSFTPLLFWFYLKWNESRKIKYLLLLSLVLSQMVFAGYIQSVFIALLGLTILYVMQNYPLKRNKTLIFGCFLIFGILLSLPQILPTLQLSHYTGRSVSSSYDFAVSIPFNTRDLCAFFSTNCFGTVKNGTYSSNWQNDGVYWENTPYLGQFFVIILLLSSIYFFKIRKKNKLVYIFFLLFLLFLLLALGKNTPLYFIFSIFPFTMFRTPPRYLLLSVFFLILYSSFIFNHVAKRNMYMSILIHVALILNCLLLIHTTFMYHLFIDSSVIYQSLNKQKIVKPGSFYITYGSSEQWNKIFLKQGWNLEKNVRDYLFINSALSPNNNLISGHASFDIFTSLETRRQQYVKSIIFDGLDLATDKHIESSRSAQLENILQLYNTTSIISFKPLFLPHFKPVQTMKEGGMIITTYQNNTNQNAALYYVPKTIQKVGSVEEIEDKIYTGTLTQEESVAESIRSTIIQNPLRASININKREDTYVKGTVVSKGNMFMVLRKNWYPEWKLYIDGKEQTIYKTNLIHMGFYVSPGRHTFELIYVPTSFYIGCFIAFIASIGIALIVLKSAQGGK